MSLVLYVVRYINDRTPVLLNNILFNFNILLIIISLNLVIITPGEEGLNVDMLKYIRIIICAFLIYTIPRYIHSMYMSDFRIIPDKIFLFTSCLLSLIKLLTGFHEVKYYINMIIFIFIFLSAAYSLFTIYRFKAAIKNARLSGVEWIKQNWIWVLCIILFIYMIIYDATSAITGRRVDLTSGFHIFSTLYMVLCVGFIMKLRDKSVPSLDASRFNPDKYNLTTREKEVALLLIKGDSYKEISSKLFVSLSTVKKHVTNIYRKTGCSSRVDLITLNRK